METTKTDLAPQQLRALILKEKAEYQRTWSQANRNKIKKYQRDYWTRKALKSYQEKEGESK